MGLQDRHGRECPFSATQAKLIVIKPLANGLAERLAWDNDLVFRLVEMRLEA